MCLDLDVDLLDLYGCARRVMFDDGSGDDLCMYLVRDAIPDVHYLYTSSQCGHLCEHSPSH